MRTIRHLAFLFCLAPFLVAQDTSLHIDYTIQYTGRLFGYARVPDTQTLGAPNGIAPSAAAAAYQLLFGKSKPALRLSMGDNFAPNLLGRTYSNPGKKGVYCPVDPDILVPKDRYYFDSKANEWKCADQPPFEDDGGDNTLESDNVAKFFIDSEYDAIVPGKHDFYFGPEWLRSVARLLGEHGVHMLGANLVISTTKAADKLAMNTFPRIPDRYGDLSYDTDFGPVSVDLPEMVLPYKRQFVVKNARRLLFRNGKGLVPQAQLATLQRKDVDADPLVAEAWVCSEPILAQRKPRDPRRIPLPHSGNNCEALQPAETVCADVSRFPHLRSTCGAIYKDQIGRFDRDTDPSRPSPDETYLFADESGHLDADTNYLFCARLNGIGKSRWTCQPFSVQLPFFTWGHKGRETEPFKLVDAGSLKLAVFGVVDPDLLSNVGLTNYEWLNANSGLDTVVKVAPADYSLRQALELCNARDDCRQAHKVLMAQMSWAKASQLIARFGEQFDLAISQADSDHGSGNETTITGSARPASPGPRLLVAPANPVSETGVFAPKLSVATLSLSRTTDERGRLVSWTLSNAVVAGDKIADVPPAGSPCPPALCLTVSSASHSALASLKALAVVTGPQALAQALSDDVRDLALLAMRKALGTDIAFLQQRDLYNAEALSSLSIAQHELQNRLQAIFWKGDYVTKFYATGATLRKILKQSKKFDELDHDALSTEIELGRKLLPLGIVADPRDGNTYYVNGVIMNDTALYSVAATQYLGLGDTGYADLATPDVPPPYRIKDLKTLPPIAGLVCQAIEQTHSYPGVKCDGMRLIPDYFDPANLRPFDETSGFDAGSHYSTLPERLISDGSIPAAGAHGGTQQRGFLSVNLENLDLAYTGTYVNHVHTSAATFAGISATGVTTTGANAINEDHRLRIIYDFLGGTFYGLSDSTLMRASTSSSSVPTLSANTVGFEGGGTIRLFRQTRPSWLSLQYSARFQGQLTDPAATAITPLATAVNPTPSAFFLPVPKASTLAGRLGLRLDHNDTWVEAGVEELDSRHILTQYQFADGTDCSPSAQKILSCTGSTLGIKDPALMLGGQPAPNVLTADFLTAGAYVNFTIKFPLWSRLDANRVDQTMYFSLANKGDFFFNSRTDTPTQTRYLDKFTPSFSIPLYGKLSLTPKVDFILFENKVLRNHYRVVEPSLSLSYSFQWREGMKFLRASGYGAITTAPGTPGSLPMK